MMRRRIALMIEIHQESRTKAWFALGRITSNESMIMFEMFVSGS